MAKESANTSAPGFLDGLDLDSLAKAVPEVSFHWKDFLDPGTLPGALVLLVVVVVVTMVLSRVLNRVMDRSTVLMRRFGHAPDQTLDRYARRMKSVLLWLAAGVVYAGLVPGLRAMLGALVAGAGITALVMGFAARSTLSNLVAGLSLAVYHPFRIGDKLEVGGHYGTVEDITLRHTILLLWTGQRYIIPNEKIDGMELLNYSITDRALLLPLEVGVSYDTDIELARRIMLEEAAKSPHVDTRKEPPFVRVIELGEYAVTLRLYFPVPDPDTFWLAKFELLENIKKRFDLEGVEIPFPYRTLVFKKDLPPAPGKEKTPRT